MSGLFSNLLRLTRETLQSACSFRQFHALTNSTAVDKIIAPTVTNTWSSVPARTIIRNNFPRAREYKRLKVHGWRVRLQTKNGRRLIMRRILKGRFYLTH